MRVIGLANRLADGPVLFFATSFTSDGSTRRRFATQGQFRRPCCSDPNPHGRIDLSSAARR